jgi:transcriptional regulator with XRE-family HTH domain
VSDLDELTKFLSESYRASYLDSYVKGSIAYQIQALREKTGLNQTKFGELIGQPQSVVSRLEDTEYGGVNINTLLKIANRLGVGLQVRFCNFETVLNADVSPAAMAVENISETVDRLSSLAPQYVIVARGEPNQINIQGSRTWQTKAANQLPLPQVFPGSGISTIGTSIPTRHSSPWALSMSP